MNRQVSPQESIPLRENQQFHPDFVLDQKRESRHFPRYKIKRRILIKDPQGNILTGHAFDISRQGLQFRCSTQIAYQLENAKNTLSRNDVSNYEVKIALPYMNELSECGIHCSIKDISKADDENMRIGLSFHYFDENSQSRLDHFIENLTL